MTDGQAPGPRAAGVDYGARRVGIAVSDELGLTVRPVGTFSPGEALSELARLVGSDGVGTVIVGWPLDDDGHEGAAVDRVRPFLGRVRKLARAAGARVEVQDERESSQRALAGLVEAGVPRGKRRRKGVLDAAAACVILRDWLDGRR